MLLSVFTPTHNHTYLQDLYRCLQNQTFRDWEWVVVPNGDMAEAITAYITQLVHGDKRVRVVPAPATMTGIGALKKFACDNCRGRVFVEVDHDDLITRDCLSTIADIAQTSPALTFIYSDAVTMSFDGTSHKFSSDFGWKQYDWDYEGRRYSVNKMHDVTPRSLCEIFYAPDHVRCWTRAAYQTSGGHDASLPVGDDHDLVVRTYLTGATFKHIRRPLYFHRLDGNTTSQKNLEKISAISQSTRDKNLHYLVREWATRNHLPMFDLGGAHNSPHGYIPIDEHLSDENGATNLYRGDVFHVVSSMKDNSVGCFRAFDFLEHIPHAKVPELMNMLYEKLAPGGYLLTNTPAVCDNDGRTGRGAYQDPDHKSFWSSNNFWYYTDRNFAKYENGAVTCRFQTIRVSNYYPSEWHKLHLIPYVLWDGMALKGDDVNYFPGPKQI